MKIPHLALSLALGAFASAAQAQQTMPGMPPAAPRQQPQQGSTPTPNRSPQPPDPHAPDIQPMQHSTGNPRGKAAASSLQNSVGQQSGQAGEKPAPAADHQSFSYPVQDVQEPEALDLRTGGDLPAPELLGDIVGLPPMTLNQFLASADTSNPTLAQAQHNIDRSQQQARQVSLPPDPILGYSGDHIRGGSYHSGEQGAFFSQEFVLGRKLALRRDIYRAQGRSDEFTLAVQRARVHNDVARAFFDALTAQQTVVLHDRLLKVALDTDTNTHELERVGQADAAAVLTAEIAAEQAKVDFLTAQRAFLASFARLATSAGQLALPPHPLTGSLVEPPALTPEDLASRDVQESPLVKLAEANVAVSQARLKDARRERIPNLHLTAGEWYSGEQLDRSNTRAGWMSFAQAGVEIPLWNRNQGNIAAAQALLNRAQKDVDRTQLWTRNQTEPLAQQYLSARFTADRYRTEMLPRARRAYQLQVLKYQQMALAYPEVLTAQHLLFTLQLGYIQALNQEWHAAIQLQNFALTNGLDQPVDTGSDATTLNLPTSPGAN